MSPSNCQECPREFTPSPARAGEGQQAYFDIRRLLAVSRPSSSRAFEMIETQPSPVMLSVLLAYAVQVNFVSG